MKMSVSERYECECCGGVHYSREDLKDCGTLVLRIRAAANSDHPGHRAIMLRQAADAIVALRARVQIKEGETKRLREDMEKMIREHPHNIRVEV